MGRLVTPLLVVCAQMNIGRDSGLAQESSVKGMKNYSEPLLLYFQTIQVVLRSRAGSLVPGRKEELVSKEEKDKLALSSPNMGDP